MQSENSGQSHLEPFRHTDSTAKDVQQSKYSENYVADNKGAHPKTLRRESSKSANLRQARGPVVIQAVCRLVSTILALAIAGLVARSLAVFNATKNYKVLMSFALVMPAWPSDYGRSLMATYLLLAAAAITLVFGILMAMTWCLLAEKTQWKGRLGHALSVVLPSISFSLFVAALVVFKLYDGPDGICGWSCMHQNIEVDFDSNEIGLGRVCNALNVAWGLGIAVAILEFVTLVIILINGLSARGHEKKKKHVKVTRTGYHELETMVDQELA